MEGGVGGGGGGAGQVGGRGVGVGGGEGRGRVPERIWEIRERVWGEVRSCKKRVGTNLELELTMV